MIVERRPISDVCDPDPQEEEFKGKVRQWVNGEINREEMMASFPSYRLDTLERLTRGIKRLFAESK